MGQKEKLPKIIQILILLLTEKFKTQKRSQKWPLKVKKNTFFNSSVLIHFWTHKERPDFDGPKSKIARNCLKINFAFDQKIPNSKTKLKNDPLNSKKLFHPQGASGLRFLFWGTTFKIVQGSFMLLIMIFKTQKSNSKMTP